MCVHGVAVKIDVECATWNGNTTYLSAWRWLHGASKVTEDTRATKQIFQIAYTEELRRERAGLLRQLGYSVISAIGNDAAKTLLSTIENVDLTLFILGHAAPEQTRKEMVDWLKANYPKVRVLALNPPNQQIPAADYNVIQNGAEKWLPFVSGL